MGGQNQPFGSGGGGSVDKALHVSAIGKVLVQLCLLAVGETHLHGDGHAAGGRHGDYAGIQHLQKFMYIVGGDCAVFIQVGEILVGSQFRPQDHMVHEELRICVIGHAVAIEVIAGQVPDRGNGLSVHQEGDLGVHGLGEGVHVEPQFGLVFVNVIFKHPLGEEVGGEGIGGVLAPQVVEGEGEGVDAGPLRIVLQLCLYLAIGLAIYQDVGGSAYRLVHSGQTCALAEDGVIIAGGFLEHGLCSGHEEALGQGPVGKTRLAQLLLLQVLHDKGSQTRHLGRRHGGTGHIGVSIGLKHGPFQGVDIAARGRDLRLDAQVAGDAPGAEGAYGEILGVFIICNNFAIYLDGTCIVGQTVFCLHGGSGGLDRCAFLLGDRNARLAAIVLLQIHIDDAGLVVVNDHCLRLQTRGHVCFVHKRSFTPGAEDDFVGQIHAGIVFFESDPINQQEFIVCAGSGQIQRRHRILHTQPLVIEDPRFPHLEIAANGAVIVHRGNCQGIGVRTGRTGSI